MNFSGFKKACTDGKCTTLKHKDGHELKIAHKALSKKLKAELDKLPGEPQMMAEGGEADSTIDDENMPVMDQPAESSVAQYADVPMKEAPAVESPRAPAAIPATIPQSQPAPVEAPQSQGLAQVAQAQPQQAAPAQAPVSQPESSIAQQPLPQETQEQKYQRAFNEHKDAHIQEYAQEDSAFAHDLQNGHITPLTYHDLFAKKSTLGKIGTIFGMMISGAGSGLSGQPNALMAMMNNEIKNDLDSQVQSKANAQNFIKINQAQQMQNAQIEQMKKQGALTDAQAEVMKAEAGMKAYTLANMQMNRAALHNLVEQVNKMPEGQQKEIAKQKLAMMSQAVSAENFQLGDVAATKSAMLNATGGLTGNSTALKLMGMKDMAEDVDSKTVPGIPGRSQIPIPQETRKQLVSQKQYDEQARAYVDFAKKHSKNWANLNLVERNKIANQGASMAANLQSLYRNKIQGGVYKKGEQEFIEQIIPDHPEKWSATFNAIPKVEQTIHDNLNDIKNTAGSVGLNYSGPKEKSDSESKEALSKSGKPIVFKNGKWVYK